MIFQLTLVNLLKKFLMTFKMASVIAHFVKGKIVMCMCVYHNQQI